MENQDNNVEEIQIENNESSSQIDSDHELDNYIDIQNQDSQKNAKFPIEANELKKIIKDNEHFTKNVMELNEYGRLKIKKGKYKEALQFLKKAKDILELAASCGKEID